MDKREAYRICHVYPDREIQFMHSSGRVVYEGVLRRLDWNGRNPYHPFTVEIVGTAKLKDGNVTTRDIGRRYKSMEDAVVHIFNDLNENAAIRNRYSCLEDILFGKG